MAGIVHVISEVVGLSSQVQKLLPCVKVISIDAKKVIGKGTDEKLPELLKNVEILLADPLVITEALYSVPTLKWAQCTWAGVDSIFKKLDSSKPLPDFLLTRSGEGFGSTMAEYVIGQIIAKERFFYQIMDEQREKIWGSRKLTSYRILSNINIGILGVGQIGTEVAKKCKAFGMTVWGLVHSNPEKRRDTCPYVDHFCSTDGLCHLLSNCDYVCSILPSTQATRGLLNGNILEACKKRQSIFINVGRGDVIEEEFLLKALKSGWLGGAILDVFPKEPLDKNSELWSLPNVVITPHVSAVSFSNSVGSLFKTNYKCFNEGKDLHYKVNWDKAY